jgi:preprotein translocase subunit SecE
MPTATESPEKPMQRAQQPEQPKSSSDQPKGGGLIERLRNTFDDIRSEIAKVTWPTREETRNLTIVVIGISAAVGILLGAIDGILGLAYGLIK